jgi:hypothetical protein
LFYSLTKSFCLFFQKKFVSFYLKVLYNDNNRGQKWYQSTAYDIGLGRLGFILHFLFFYLQFCVRLFLLNLKIPFEKRCHRAENCSNAIMSYRKNLRKHNDTFKGTVQRKLTWVKSGINRKLMIWTWAAWGLFDILGSLGPYNLNKCFRRLNDFSCSVIRICGAPLQRS